MGGGRRGERAVGGNNFPAVGPQTQPPCQRLISSVGRQADRGEVRQLTINKQKIKTMEILIEAGTSSSCTSATKLKFSCWLMSVKFRMYSGKKHQPTGMQCFNSPTNPPPSPQVPFIFPYHLANPFCLWTHGGLFYKRDNCLEEHKEPECKIICLTI